MEGRALAELLFRLIYILRFAVFMAACYVLFHGLAARLCRPDSKVLAFFRTVTGPLTRPIRAVAPALSEAGVRALTLSVLGGAWLVCVWLLTIIGTGLD
jgi:hypothetical protein